MVGLEEVPITAREAEEVRGRAVTAVTGTRVGRMVGAERTTVTGITEAMEGHGVRHLRELGNPLEGEVVVGLRQGFFPVRLMGPAARSFYSTTCMILSSSSITRLLY